MRIYSMTATFGKLEHETLTLQPGLNILDAPNEWGKSTWCAFLLAMFYGLDTRAKSRKTALAEKQRYAPWSGSPMAGRIDLCWQGRDITIERTSHRRVPLGEFRAYETASGLIIPELTGENAGEMLLGVEGSVYRRAGFIRFQDLPVTQDEALRRRLQALVTTGDDSGSADLLESKLRDLRNRVRYNRSGLLPQEEASREKLEQQLSARRDLDRRREELAKRLRELEAEEGKLRLHLDHLYFREAGLARARYQAARTRLEEGEARRLHLEQLTARLPAPEKIEEKLSRLESLGSRQDQTRRELTQLPREPEERPLPPPYDGQDPMAMVIRDTAQWESARRYAGPGWFLGVLAAALLAGLFGIGQYLSFAVAAAAAALVLLVLGLIFALRKKSLGRQLEEKYGSLEPDRWEQKLRDLQWSRKERQKSQALLSQQRHQLEGTLLALEREKSSLCGSQTPETVAKLWREALGKWKELEALREELRWRSQDLTALEEALPEIRQPGEPDPLDYSREDTEALLKDAASQHSRLLERLGQLKGRGETMEDAGILEARLVRTEARIRELEDIYAAVSIALEQLTQARLELQRRFAPVIVKEATEYMSRLTGGRYDRLTLDSDFSLAAGAAEEDGVASILWRSDGTADQLYLALRLAVARELTPEAPLVLDDALVRFDDARLKTALELLRELSSRQQVLLFTCQDREKRALLP